MDPGDAYVEALLETLKASEPQPEPIRKTWHERLLGEDPWEDEYLVRKKPKKKGPEPRPGSSDRRSPGGMQYLRHGCRFAVAFLLFFAWTKHLGGEFLVLACLVLFLAVESVRMDLKPELKKRWTGR